MCAKYSDKIQRPVLIGVEGADFFYLLLNYIQGRPEFSDIQLFDLESNTGKWLAVIKLTAGFGDVRALGIIRDAEEDSNGARDSVKGALLQHGFNAPNESNEVTEGHPCIGYLIVPHGKKTGCIENSLLEAYRAKNSMKCIDDYVKCVNDSARNENWRAKVAVHAIIAASENPRNTLGESAKAGLWDFAQPSLAVISDFLKAIATKSASKA